MDVNVPIHDTENDNTHKMSPFALITNHVHISTHISTTELLVDSFAHTVLAHWLRPVLLYLYFRCSVSVRVVLSSGLFFVIVYSGWRPTLSPFGPSGLMLRRYVADGAS